MAYGLRNRGMPKPEIETRVREAAKILELEPMLDRKPRQLSGGQRQRVAMGRAIVRHPQVFLFDEPLSNLDAKLRVQMRLELQKLHRRLGVTSLYVTHDQVEAMTLGQRIIVMNAGRAEQIGTPEQIYARPASTFVASFMGSPPMNLVNGVPSADGTRFEAQGHTITLPATMDAGGSMPRVLGVRPEKLRLGGSQMQAEVEMVESLGADHLIHCRLGEQALVLRTAESALPKAGDSVGLGFHADAMHWFDAKTTQRLS
jgi:sn-glycerol 3-phosphate transport system ATP-binding protein